MTHLQLSLPTTVNAIGTDDDANEDNDDTQLMHETMQTRYLLL